MYNRPGFVNKKGIIYSADNKVPSEALPAIHTDSLQGVQGGVPAVRDANGVITTPGEHFHLSTAAYDALIVLLNNRLIREPLFTVSGEIITEDTGDWAYVELSVPAVPAIV